MKKNKSIILTMAIATAMALTGCGNKEESKTTEKGKVEIESSATEAGTTDSSADTQATEKENTDNGNGDSGNEAANNENANNEDSGNEDSSNEDSDNEDSDNEDSNIEDSDDEESDDEDSDDDDYDEDYEVETKEPTIDVGTLKESTVINYNGVTFSIGETEEEVVAKLGEQYAPSAERGSCMAGKFTEYYYSNMNIQAKNGVIFLVEIMDNGYGGDIVPSLVSGITIGTDADTIEACYGISEHCYKPRKKGNGYTYVDNYYFVYFRGDFEEDGEGVNEIEMYDSNLIPEDYGE